jgi:hypothetical protein
MRGSREMALWNASIGWVTMVVRAPSAAEAREIAVANVKSRDLDGTVGCPPVTEDWPSRLDEEGPPEILIEDID